MNLRFAVTLHDEQMMNSSSKSHFRAISYLCKMDRDILQLYEKSRSVFLSSDEAAWLESQTVHYPYFGMTYMLLARYYDEQNYAFRQKMLSRAAGYSLSRGILRSYMLSIASQGIAQEEIVETPVREEPVELEQETATLREVQPVILPEEVVEEIPVDTAEPEEHTTSVLEPVSTETELPSEKPAVVSEQSHQQPVSFHNPGINHYLQMRIRLLVSKYTRMAGVISGQIHVPAALPASDVPLLSEPDASGIAAGDEKSEAEMPASEMEQPEAPAVHLTVVKEEVSEEGIEEQEVMAEAPVIELQLSANPEVNESAEEEEHSVLDFSSLKPENGVLELAPVELPSRETEWSESEYEIGAFSSLQFIDETEAESETEVDLTTVRPPAVEIVHNPEDPDDVQEILVDGGDRLLEIRVTQEQLEKYFQFIPKRKIEKKEGKSDLPQNKEEDMETSGRKKQSAELIDKFIETEPSISRPDPAKIRSGDLARTSAVPTEELVTETLAWIHARQGNTQKAIRMYEKLILRFPEKSAYFAGLIEKLKK